MEKEFGKLSVQQIIDFYIIFCNFVNEYVDDLEDLTTEKFAIDIFPVRWYKLYEVDLKLVTAGLTTLIGFDEEIKIAVTYEDPQQYIIDLLKSGYQSPRQKEDFDDQQLVNLVGHLICMLMYFVCFSAYRTDLRKLLNEARDGHKESLYKAINIDSSILSTEEASMHISKAILEDNGDFFDALSKAIKGGYSKKPSEKYALLNFFVYIVEDAAGETVVDREELHRLFTEQIPLYPGVTKLQDSFGSFHTQLRRMKHKVKDTKS